MRSAAGDAATPPGHERDERDEPEDELRREHAAEGELSGDDGRAVDHEAVVVVHSATPPRREPHGDDHHHRRDATERARDLPERARHVGAPHLACATLGDADAEAPEAGLVGGHSERDRCIAREALDLDAPGQLGSDREPRLGGRDRHEREDHDGDRRRSEPDREPRLPSSAAPPDVQRDERDEEKRIELGGDREAEGDPGEAGASVQERGDARRGQRDGESVEPGERELAEEQGRRADEAEGDRGVADRHAERGEGDRR